MPKNPKQKQKLLYIMKFFMEKTDDDYGVTVADIIDYLDDYGITAERKSIYRDIDALRKAGIEVKTLPTRPVQYAFVRGDLHLDDVMMLVDAVQSSRFITERKSNQLVKSLKNLVSERERKLLDKRVHVKGRVKSKTDSVFHNVDVIHEALQRKRKIQFLYFSYGTDLKRKARHEGKRYELTPAKVVYADNNYYLAAYDDADGIIKTYRIDRMELLQISDAPATRCAEIANYEYGDFAYQSFGMFHGEQACVTLRASAPLMDAIVDRFGRDVEVVKAAASYAEIRVNVHVSPQFFGWIAGLSGSVTIRAPRRIADYYKEWLRSLIVD